MTATNRRTCATEVVDHGKLRLNTDLFDTLAARKGATTHQQRIDLIQVDRATYFRWRQGATAPSLDVALRIADRLGTTVDRLWPRVKTAA